MSFKRLISLVPCTFIFATTALAQSSLDTASPLVRVGFLAARSGDYAVSGEDCDRGFEVGRRELAPDDRLNGVKIEFIKGDHQAKPQVGLAEFNKMLNLDLVQAVIADRSQVVMSFNPISKTRSIPLLGVVGAPKFVEQNPSAFRFWPSTAAESDALAEYASSRNVRSFAVVTLEDEYPVGLSENFSESIRRRGGEIIFSESVAADFQSWASLLVNIRKHAPEGIFVNVGTGQIGPFIRKIREAGLKTHVFGNFWIRRAEEIQAAGSENIEGAIFAEISLNEPKFLQSLERHFPGSQATAMTYACYSAAGGILGAVARLDSSSEKTTSALSDALGAMSQFRLLDGPAQLLNREVMYKLAIKVVRNGKVQDVVQ